MTRLDLTPPRVGDLVGDYRIVEELHSGGMGLLYRVAGVPPMVMKLPRTAFGSHPGHALGFEAESHILLRLRGVHVPRLVALGDWASQPYLVMEEVAGQPLTDWLARSPLPAGQVAELGARIATALHALHAQEVVHLDLKPAHVLFRPSGEAVLLDFGLARHAHLPDWVGEEMREPAGTPAGIAPEQLLGRRCDPRSDLFALGVILYQLATGRLPFGAPTSLWGLRRRRYQLPTPPRALAPDLPPWLQELILRCLEPAPEARHATALQLAHDLVNPEEVPLTERAARLQPAPWRETWRRWWRARRYQPPDCLPPTQQLATAPHLLLALDPQQDDPALWQALRTALVQTSHGLDQCRVTLVSVIAPLLTGGEEASDALDQQAQAHQRILLHHLATELPLPETQVRLRVLVSSHPAQALVEYARQQGVDHLLLGAHTRTGLRRLLGSVSTQVAAEAPCSVTLVRPRRLDAE